jgi:hypothetical protein
MGAVEIGAVGAGGGEYITAPEGPLSHKHGHAGDGTKGVGLTDSTHISL